MRRWRINLFLTTCQDDKICKIANKNNVLYLNFNDKI